jgi:F-type H+-transporting ATPase subunit a
MHSLLELVQLKEKIPGIEPHVLFSTGPLTFATSTMMILLAILTFLFVASKVSKFKLVPKRFQGGVEIVIETVINFLAQIVGSKETALKIFPYVGSVFLFIIFSNLFFLIPFISSVTYHGEHVFSASTADFNTTFALAFASVILLQVASISEKGLFNYLGHFIQIKPIITGFRKSFGAGMSGIIHFFVGIIEIIGEFAKIISLSLRLFGNIFAHEVLTIIILGALAIGLPVVWMGMGVLVGLVQAVVFMALITVYYTLAVKKEEGHH